MVHIQPYRRVHVTKLAMETHHKFVVAIGHLVYGAYLVKKKKKMDNPVNLS